MANEIKKSEFKQRQEYLTQMKDALMEKVGTAQAVILLGKTPKGEIRKRLMNPKKPKSEYNPEFSYLEHAFVEETLNFAFMLNWNVEVISKERIGEEAFVEILLTATFKDGSVIKKSGFGGAMHIANNPNTSWGDVFKSAYSDAIKNAATKLGIGLDLYRHEEKAVEKAVVIQEEQKARPVIKDSTDPALPSQIETLKGMGVSEEEAKKMNKQEASDKIRELANR